MTNYNKATLITFFQQNDVPQGSDYANLITSQVNLVETALQTMAGPLQMTEVIASRVSSGNGNFTGTMTVAGQVSAKANFKTKSLTASAAVINNGTITATLLVSGQTSANNLNVAGDFIRAPITYTAAGTTQATATPVVAGCAVLTGASDGQTTGYILLANKAGLTQQIYNQNTVSANLWPCVGGQINVLASNAAFGMLASTLYTVFHTKASGYAVK